MKFSFEFEVDQANKLLICEAYGELSEVVDLEHMLKTIVKIAGKNQVKNIVLDITAFKILLTNVDIANLLITFQENDWLGDLKIAKIINPEFNIHNVIQGLAESLSLPIKNFENRSEAMLWLLFDKVRAEHK
tara:strand:- start:4446 stop:4841 length:396 start_codon:yes stop_codon:yes gene_type:complete